MSGRAPTTAAVVAARRRLETVGRIASSSCRDEVRQWKKEHRGKEEGRAAERKEGGRKRDLEERKRARQQRKRGKKGKEEDRKERGKRKKVREEGPRSAHGRVSERLGRVEKGGKERERREREREDKVVFTH